MGKQLTFKGMAKIADPTIRLRENDVEKQINDFLRWRGWFPIRLHAGRFKTLDHKRFIGLNKKGTPDWVAVHPRLGNIFYELKAPKKKPTKDQLLVMQELAVQNFTVGWWDSLDTFMSWYEGEFTPRQSAIGAVAPR